MRRKVFYLGAIAVLVLASVNLGPSAYAADTSPPELLDWTLKTPSGDISNSDARFTVTFIISDDSTMDNPNLLLKSTSTSQLTAFADVKEVASSGKLKSFEATAVVKKGQSPRKWEWVLYPLRDSLGNTNNKFGPEEKFTRSITVWDSTYTFETSFCENGVQAFNKAALRFREFELNNPNSELFSVAKLKYNIADYPVSEVLCITKPEETRNKYSVATAADITTEIANLSIKVAELKAKQEAEAKAKLEAIQRAESEAKAKAEAEAKAAAELKAKQEAETAAKAAAAKKITITCVKGKTIKKVIAVKPKCPKGYKKK